MEVLKRDDDATGHGLPLGPDSLTWRHFGDHPIALRAFKRTGHRA